MSINYTYKDKNLDIKSIKLTECEDNYVGFFEVINHEVCNHDLWFCKNLRRINSKNIKINCNKFLKNTNKKNLVIVLESPHIDEFNGLRCNIAPAPALGVTGCNLDKYFIELINSKINNCGIEDGVYNVILTNAIQYQCSLGEEPEIYRDRVWLDLWLFKNYNSNFIQRLYKYSPDVIINFCTKGSHRKDHLRPKGTKTFINAEYINSINKNHNITGKVTLRELVSKEIKNNFKNNCIILEGNHPSSWNRGLKHRTLSK
ncbi:hypothetical protein LI063_05410 [Clostridium perfringens]|uniref:hypothetical protein n=1 Tax=Clostridium perfringens TaxID=1502 RepID=UPI00115BB75A|nr:hypothetical protein [Clostridium perfringens]ELC8462487.1 hypothetical protein [Clostridium perfringens]MBO3395059.1 hypothetical protein [Clostridium perfringens]MBO3400872.1 hypothetical protein [Clostridium perfringens]MCX0363595.1 hypothetical protein [Clostridium perfringens]MDM0632865.1 hypothetical protein [Clostridium perfringens]